MSAGPLTALFWLFKALAVAAFVAEAWAFVDSLRRPSQAFVSVGKQSKPLWLIILGVATAIGLYFAAVASGFTVIGILPIAAFVAAAIYLTDVRPKVKDFRGGTGGRQGPYGPW